jgi:hypothetical protein
MALNFKDMTKESNEIYTVLPAVNLIDEMVWYSKREHAKIVFRKCLKASRLKWAMKIAYYYDLNENRK